jgi:hypothetical protein
MINKFFILLTSFIYTDVPAVEQERVIVIDMPEDEIVIENIRPEMASMYY